MSERKACDPCHQVWIKRVNPAIKEDINNIAGHSCMTTSRLLRDAIKMLVNSYPEDIREGKRKPCEPGASMLVRGVGKKTKEELGNIAQYLGVDVGDLVKHYLPSVVNAHPKYMTEPIED